ncbi:Protein PPP5D1 [Plecturocebus cupreus]
MLPRLVSNSWPHVIFPPKPPKMLGLQRAPVLEQCYDRAQHQAAALADVTMAVRMSDSMSDAQSSGGKTHVWVVSRVWPNDPVFRTGLDSHWELERKPQLKPQQMELSKTMQWGRGGGNCAVCGLLNIKNDTSATTKSLSSVLLISHSHFLHLALLIYFLKETESCYVAQAGLELLDSRLGGFSAYRAFSTKNENQDELVTLLFMINAFTTECRQGLALLPRLKSSGTITAHCSVKLLGSSHPPTSHLAS